MLASLSWLLLVLEGVSGTVDQIRCAAATTQGLTDTDEVAPCLPISCHIRAWLSGNTLKQFTFQFEIASQHVRIYDKMDPVASRWGERCRN